LLFAVGWAMRRVAFPRWLCGMGLISYSLYLLHQIPLQVLKKMMGGPDGLPLSTRLIWAGGLFAVVIALSTLTYRLVELPMQRLGRRLGSRASRSSIR
jgi:peptidoglycan/LPS O-acetylase OafA/YrhL